MTSFTAQTLNQSGYERVGARMSPAGRQQRHADGRQSRSGSRASGAEPSITAVSVTKRAEPKVVMQPRHDSAYAVQNSEDLADQMSARVRQHQENSFQRMRDTSFEIKRRQLEADAERARK